MSDTQNQLIDALCQAVIAGDQDKSQDLAGELLRIGVEPLKILTDGLTKGLSVVGERFGSGEMFLTELMLAAEAMKSGLRVVEPELKKAKVEREYIGTIVIGTVEGDIHDIGKTIVSTMLEVNGFHVYDLGTDVKTDSFMEKVAQLKPNLLGLSALLSTTMGKQEEVTPEWAQEIGADGYAPDAIAAVDIAKRLVA
jgi:methanogenic corrinoid protein MtbC1